MNGSGRAGNGRGNNRKRPFRRHEKDTTGNDQGQTSFSRAQANNKPEWSQENQNRQSRNYPHKKSGDTRREKAVYVERPRWIPPVISNDPLPNPDCPWCGKPIRDLASAISDKDTGVPIHFDCVAARIAGAEVLCKGEFVSYLGGGRFGIVGGTESRSFKIKKIIEWENKDKKAEWRIKIGDQYTIT